MEALGDPGKSHDLNDHNKPVRFMLQSFEDSHEYRAKWKNVDDRIGRNGKKMKTYHGTSYASAKNEQGICSITIKTPRVGTYRVDIEQRFGYQSSRHKKHETTGTNEKKNSIFKLKKVKENVGEAIENVEESAGKCVHRLRQVIEHSKKWEIVAGSPKYIVAKFNVGGYNLAAKMQNEKPDDIIEHEDVVDESLDIKKLLIQRTLSMPNGVGDFNKLGGTLKIEKRKKRKKKATTNKLESKNEKEVHLDAASGQKYSYDPETGVTEWLE